MSAETVVSGGVSEPSARRQVGRSALARVIVLGVSTVLGIFTTQFIVVHFGEGAYTQYGMLVSLGMLLAFLDLGVGASLMNAISQSDDPRHDPHVRAVLIACLRVLVCSTAVLLALVVLVRLTGGFPAVFGGALLADGGSDSAALCLTLIACTMPLGVGQRILVGLARTHLWIVIMGLQAPIMFGLVVLLAHQVRGAGPYLPVVTYAVTFTLAAAAFVVAVRLLRPLSNGLLRDVLRPRVVRGARVISQAWPMLVQLIVTPIVMQTDRIILSHVSSVGEVARYNLASQLFSPIYAVASAAGLALWPIYAKARVSAASRDGAASRDSSPIPMSIAFALTALAAGLVLLALQSPLARLATGGKIGLSYLLCGAFVALMVVLAARYPLGMFLTDPKGMRFQAYFALLALPVNIGLSIVLAQRWGAIGPIVGSVVGFGIFGLVANLVYLRQRARQAVVLP